MASFTSHFSYHLPKLLALILLLVNFLPLKIPGMLFFFPLTSIMIIYFWCIYRPELMPLWFVFVLGVLQDALYGSHLGVMGLAHLILWVAVVSQRRLLVNEPFIVVWCGFIVFSFGIVFLEWGIISMLYKQVHPFGTACVRWLLSIALYVCMHYVFNVINKVIPPSKDFSHAR